MTLFADATRENWLFDSVRGQLNVISLWSLPLKNGNGANLNEIAKAVSATIKDTEEDFVEESANRENNLARRKLELVKYIIKYKKDVQAAALVASERKEQKQLLLSIKNEKQKEKYKNMSEAELDAELAKL